MKGKYFNFNLVSFDRVTMDDIRHRHRDWLTIDRRNVDWKHVLDDSDYDGDSDDPDQIDPDML